MLFILNLNVYNAIAVVLILLYMMLFYFGRGYRFFNSCTFVIALYLGSLIGSWFLDPTLVPNIEKYSLFATLLFVFCFLAFALPLVLSRIERVKFVYVGNERLFWFFCKTLIFSNCIVYLYFTPQLISIVTSGESIINLRSHVVGGTADSGSGVLFSFISLMTQFYPIALLCFFYSFCYYPEKKALNTLLFWSSTGYIINVFASIGRDGVVLWSFSFVFTYLIFFNQIDKSRKRKIKKYSSLFFAFFFVVFISLSIGRFYRDGNVYMFFQYMLMYFSQQFGEFNQYVNSVSEFSYDWSKLFPLLNYVGMGNDNDMTLLDEHYHFLSNYGFSKYVFKTFIGSFYMSIGSIGIIGFSVLLSLSLSILFYFRRKDVVSLGLLVIYTVYAQLLLHGIFYYKLAHSVSQVYIILSLFVAIAFHYKIKLSNIRS
ncbi:oligosaccharide repeat unit polymerase [Vibrio satsumensis]|uniref:O-antigen polymerase n=1 Tax=Vibrio satsumensis TaxID=2910245 RepID=UPI003D0BF639